MADFTGADLSGARIERVDLSGARLRAVNLTDARLRGVNLTGARFHGVNVAQAVLRGVEMLNVEIDAELENVTINGVDIAPLIDAELNRRDPDRAKMRPTDPAGFVQAWDVIERRWGETVDRARRLPPELSHESVDGEWSFIETLRHLVYASEAWVSRAILGDPSPWDALSLPWDEMPDTPGTPRDREARPSLDTVLALRRDRQATVRQVIEGLTDASLAQDTKAVQAPGWPPPRSFPVQECLRIVLNEEWEHRRYAERDLTAIEERLS